MQMQGLSEMLAGIIGGGVALSGPVIWLVESIKATELIPTKYMFLVSLLVGIVFGVLVGLIPEMENFGNVYQFALAGMTAGATASGLYNKVIDNKLTK